MALVFLGAFMRMGSMAIMWATISLAAAATALSSGEARREGSVWSAEGTWSMSAASFGLATSGPSSPSGRFVPATLRFFFCCDFERGVGGGAPGTMRWAGGAASDIVCRVGVEDVEKDEWRARFVRRLE